jgi:hypothetical protein
MALRAPPQRTLRIAALAIIRKPVKIVEHHRIGVNDPPATRASTTHTPLEDLAATEIRNPPPDRRRRDPGRPNHSFGPAIAKRDRLRGRPQTLRALRDGPHGASGSRRIARINTILSENGFEG